MHTDFPDKLFYWKDGNNFGDELSLYLVEKITGRTFCFADQYKNKKLVAIGSLLCRDVMETDSLIWGTGTLSRDSLMKRPVGIFPINRRLRSEYRRLKGARARVFAVRGPLSRGLLLSAGFVCPAVYGDPAIVLPGYYSPDVTMRSGIGLVLHHTQEGRFNVDKLGDMGVRNISVHRSGDLQIESFINSICSCERVFSSSLHGLIVAQSYGIPAQWVRIPGSPIHQDEEHKFFDYFLGSGQIVQMPLVIEGCEGIAHVINMTMSPIKPFSCASDLLDVFPLY